MAALVKSAGGYGYKFVSPVHDKWLCLACHLPLKDPMQIMGCGHRLCTACMAEVLSHPEARCPADQQPITDDKVFLDAGCKRDILDLHIKCPNDDCSWTGELRAVETKDHLNECAVMVIPCEFQNMGCDAKFPRREMDDHMEASMKSHLQLTCQQIELRDKQIKMRDKRIELRDRLREQEYSKRLGELEKTIEKLLLRDDSEMNHDGSYKWRPRQYGAWGIPNSYDGSSSFYGYSDPFYLQGYRMKLSVKATSISSKMEVKIAITSGKFDDELEWPLGRKIIADVHASLREKKSTSFQPDENFLRPGPDDSWESSATINFNKASSVIDNGYIILRFE